MNKPMKLSKTQAHLPARVDAIFSFMTTVLVGLAVVGAMLLLGGPLPAGAAVSPARLAVTVDANAAIDAQRNAARFPLRFATPGGNPLGRP